MKMKDLLLNRHERAMFDTVRSHSLSAWKKFRFRNNPECLNLPTEYQQEKCLLYKKRKQYERDMRKCTFNSDPKKCRNKYMKLIASLKEQEKKLKK